MSTRKHFVLAPETIVSKKDVTQSFASDNTVYLLLNVLKDVESQFYFQTTERGRIARHNLNVVGNYNIKDLQKGVVQDNGSILKVIVNHSCQNISDDEVKKLNLSPLDSQILEACLDIKKEVHNEPVILVSKRPSLRHNAQLLGITAQTFRDELLPELNEQYTGRIIIELPDSKIKEFREKKSLSIESILSKEKASELYQNMFVEFKGIFDWANGRVENDKIVTLQYEDYHPYKVSPKNVGQKFAIECLMADEKRATLVIIKGVAGTAKTFLSLATGLEHVENLKHYKNKILISRLPTETGESIGYLPGTEEEKIMPYLRGTIDNLVALNEDDTSTTKSKKSKAKSSSGLSKNLKPFENEEEKENIFFSNGTIKAEAIGYIRGRSICDTFIIIDEAQNLSPAEAKTIITRVGSGSKLILIGDPSQVDRPELDERNNGLSYASEHLKGEPNCWQIAMTEEESVRSELAKRASMLL